MHLVNLGHLKDNGVETILSAKQRKFATSASDDLIAELVDHIITDGYSERPVNMARPTGKEEPHYRSIRRWCNYSGYRIEDQRTFLQLREEAHWNLKRPSHHRCFLRCIALTEDGGSENVWINERAIGKLQSVGENELEDRLEGKLLSQTDDFDEGHAPVPATRSNRDTESVERTGSTRENIISRLIPSYPDEGEHGCATGVVMELMYHDLVAKITLIPRLIQLEVKELMMI
ncbi:hypothetical protein TRICI_005741 [Trichomonascus ciferrii]|uniref:Uncharacterized protein n=1 Tax=Trichomonascus ciferrii TaxID=44093 RepID=A0A642UUE2_9ASCO|nr:hypothetical protein TRICI_005741 [Trichomonascus ciferrii]